jgi:hypothetical protein
MKKWKKNSRAFKDFFFPNNKKNRKIWTAPKSLDKFIINFDNNELDIVSGSFCLNLI